MALRNWHWGKLVMLWAVALVFLRIGFASHEDGLALFGLLAIAAVGVSTWRWLTAREESNRPRDASNRSTPDTPPDEHPGPDLAEQLYQTVAAGHSELLQSSRDSVAVGPDRLRLEAFALRAHAVHLTTYLRVQEPRLQSILGQFYAVLKNHDGLPIAGTELMKFLTDRGSEYAAAVSVLRNNSAFDALPPEAIQFHFTGNPPQDAGMLFAHFCGAARNPIVQLAGATMFADAAAAAKNVLESEKS